MLRLHHMASVNVNDKYLSQTMKDFNVKIRSGSNLVKVRPLFSYNSKCLIAASGPNIKVFNVQSCECLHILRYHKTNVVSLQENKSNCLQFFSCSQDGVVVRWELVEGTLLKVYDLLMPVVSFYAPSNTLTWFVTKKIEEKGVYRLYSITQNKTLTLVMQSVMPDHNAISFGFEGKFVAGINENSLSIYQFEEKRFVKHLCGTNTLQCVTCHPTDLVLATGDNQGKILVWSNLFDSKRPIRSIYHWHSLPVSDLAFSSEGSHLYSGGGEAVLVKWSLFSEEKHTLPRLGAPIAWIKYSPDNTYVIAALEDNSLQVIDPHRNVVGLIQGLTRGCFRGDPKLDILSTGLLYDPQTKCLVLNGKPGHLQFYSVFDDKHLFNLDISAKNFISHERDHLNYNVDVSKTAIDERGQWLATVEYWCNGEVSPMIWLKFWEYNVVNQKFVMNTNIYLPHDKEVNCLLFRPYDTTDTSPLAVTTSNDCRFKTWALYIDDDFEGKQSWNCSSMDYYRDRLPTSDASYSEDGSVLAVAVSNIATLWTDNNQQLEAALFHEMNEKPIKQLRFGKQTCNHLLVCHDGSKIYVWNILSLSITFTIHVDVQTIAADMNSDLMVAFSKDTDDTFQNLYLFKPNSPDPVFFKRNVSEKPVLSALFVPKNTKNKTDTELCSLEKSQLFFFNEDQCLLTLTDECDDDLDSNLNKIKISANLPMTPFGFLQAEQKASNVKKVGQQHLVIERMDTGKDSLEYPNPTYVDHFAVCSKMLRSLMRPKPSRESDTHEDTENKKTKTRQEKMDSNQSEPIKLEDIMGIETDKKAEDFTVRVTDFSFLNKYVNLPMS